MLFDQHADPAFHWRAEKAFDCVLSHACEPFMDMKLGPLPRLFTRLRQVPLLEKGRLLGTGPIVVNEHHLFI
jgi:hypothetical protein